MDEFGMMMKHPICLTAVIFLMLASTVHGGAVLKLKMVRYGNPSERLWDGSCCDTFCWSDCDHTFKFSLDRASSNDDPKTYHYWSQTTGTYQDQNSITFSSHMNGVNNPIVWHFTDGWPGAIKFKVYIEDDDTPWSGDDRCDGIVQLLRLTPSRSIYTAQWTSIVMRGVRPSHKTSLTMQYMLYCDTNYYTSDCSVHCVPHDSDTEGHYTCNPTTGAIVCRPGWEDPLTKCKTPSDDCIGNQCQNGATCVDGRRRYTCQCPPGYTGVHCQININECASSPCRNNGTCTDRVNGFTCDCPRSFVGRTCSQPYCQTVNPCKNGATCYGAGSCLCTQRFVGADCSVDRCDLLTCENGGTCLNGVCQCLPGFSGTTCDIVLCDFIRCLNGGTCRNGMCICKPGYNGVVCENDIDDCFNKPCLNDATCEDRLNGFECQCPSGFSGRLCSKKKVVNPKDAETNSSNSLSPNLSAIEDQPSEGIESSTLWFYLSSCIIFVLLVVIIILSVLLALQRRKNKSVEEKPVVLAAAAVRADENEYDKSMEDDQIEPIYQSIGGSTSGEDSPVKVAPGESLCEHKEIEFNDYTAL